MTPPLNFFGDLQLTFTATSTHRATLSDGSQPTSTKSVTQTIDINITPDESLSSSSVAENSPNGTVVGRVTTNFDPNGPKPLYTLTDNAGDRFAIDQDGVIKVANGTLLDFETRHSYTISVRTTDPTSGNFVDNTFTLDVTDVNEAPTGVALSQNTIPENTSNGTLIGTLTGTDPDAGDVLTYSLVDSSGNPIVGGPFAIVGNKLVVADATLLDFETTPSLPIIVRATDKGRLFFDENLTVKLTNVNEAPTDAGLAGSTVEENAANGTVVGTVTGTDPDRDALSYALTNNAGGRFAIDAHTGVITVADGTKLDFESAKTHDITVQVSDPSGLSFTTTFTIQVTDVNEPPTDATLTNNSIPENLPAGSVVGVVIGTDPDAGETLHYSLIRPDGSSGGDDGIFAITPDTGVITVKDPSALNFENLPVGGGFSVQVRVTDSAQHSIDRTFFITVTNVNEAPTIEGLSAPPVFILSDPGTEVGTVTATDPDGDPLIYTLDGPETSGQIPVFSIAPNGVISVNNLPSSFPTGPVRVTVQVADQGPLGDNKSFDIEIVAVIARPDEINAGSNVPLLISTSDLTANDRLTGFVTSPGTGTDSRVLVSDLPVIAVNNVQHGTAVLNPQGQILFTPEDGFIGIAQFDYTVSNGRDAPSTATVFVNVDPPPLPFAPGHAPNGPPSNDSSASAVLSGTSRDDILIAGGNVTLIGGGGIDTYHFGPSPGQSVINNFAQDGASGPRSRIQFDAGTSSNNLWFEQKGNDLQISRHHRRRLVCRPSGAGAEHQPG